MALRSAKHAAITGLLIESLKTEYRKLHTVTLFPGGTIANLSCHLLSIAPFHLRNHATSTCQYALVASPFPSHPGGLVPVGGRGLRQGPIRKQTHLPLSGVQHLPLVPRHGGEPLAWHIGMGHSWHSTACACSRQSLHVRISAYCSIPHPASSSQMPFFHSVLFMPGGVV